MLSAVLALAVLTLTQEGWGMHTAGLPPVVIIPSFGGSALDATLDGTEYVRHSYCTAKSSGFRLWLNEEELASDCWIDHMTMDFGGDPPGFRDAPGVTVTPVPGCRGIRSLDTSGVLRYGALLIEGLMEDGYECGANLIAAPYDWRRAPPSLAADGYFTRLAATIESAVEANGLPAVMICHSNGCLAAAWFLSRGDGRTGGGGPSSAAWKRAHVAALVSVAAPWTGTTGALEALLSGDPSWFKFGPLEIVDRLRFRAASRTVGSIMWMVSQAETWGEEILVSTPGRNYTAGDVAELLAAADRGAPAGAGGASRGKRGATGPPAPPMADTWRYLAPLNALPAHPGVELHCLFGSGMDTPLRLQYEGGDFDREPTRVMGPGDKSVLQPSLEFCRGFAKKQPGVAVHPVDLPGLEHHTSIQDPRVIAYVRAVAKDVAMSRT